MHLITFKDTPEVAATGNVKPGTVVCLDTNAFEIALAHQALLPEVSPYKEPLHAVNDRILLIFTMGYGDAIMLTPVLREMKKRNPKAEIHIACWQWTRQVFFNLPYVDGFLDYPPRLESLQDFGQILTLEHSVEFNLMARAMHMTDRFAQHLGLFKDGEEWTDNKKPEIALSGDEREWAKTTFERTKGVRRLALQVQAGVRARTYPISQLSAPRESKVNGHRPSVLNEMIIAGWEICLVGAPGEFRVDTELPKGMIDTTRLGMTFRQSCAFLTTCDAVLAPDSSMMHAAGTLGIPCVAFFGPFPYRLRTAYYDSVFALIADGGCKLAPCFWTTHTGLPLFPPEGPCNKTGICTELAAIRPEIIRLKLEELVPR